MSPQGRQALGLGLVMIAGLLYVGAGYAIKAIAAKGVSSLLISYASTCLFVLHLPCAFLVRWCQGGAFWGRLGFRELPHKDKTSDDGSKSPRQWKELRDVVEAGKPDEETSYALAGGGFKELAGGQGLELVDGAAKGGVETGGMGSPGEEKMLPLGLERSWGSVSSRVPSEPQTPTVSVLDTWQSASSLSKPVELRAPRGGALKQKVVISGFNEEETGLEREERGAGCTVEGGVPAILAHETGDPQIAEGEGADIEAADYTVLGDFEAQPGWDLGTDAFQSSRGMVNLVTPALCAEHLQAARVALIVFPLWFLAQYTYTLSLTLTSVSSNTIIFTCNCLFTFLISILWLKEPFTLFKLGMIACAMIGTAVVSISDANRKSDTGSGSGSKAALGNGVTLVAAMLYALYGTTVKYTMPEEPEADPNSFPLGKGVKKPISTSLVFGYMGLLGGVLLLPMILLLYCIGLESLHWMGGKVFGLLIVKSIFGNVVSDYFCARAMLLTSPTAASVGLAFQTPVAILADLFVFGIYPKPLMLFGGVLVLWGLFGINLNFGQDSKKKAMSA